MKIGTVTLNFDIDKDRLFELVEVNSLDLLFIQYVENDLYNIDKKINILGDCNVVEESESFLKVRANDLNILVLNTSDEDQTWDILDEHLTEDIDVLLGFFLEDADSNTHFELTFDFVDSYKELCHESEDYPEYTDKISQLRNTWILTQTRFESNCFEVDKLINGVWVDVRN